jgi:hypothetical protein
MLSSHLFTLETCLDLAFSLELTAQNFSSSKLSPQIDLENCAYDLEFFP